MVQEPEDEDLVEAAIRHVELPRVGGDEGARPGAPGVVDVARVQVGAHVVVAGEEVGEGARAAAQVEGAQAGAGRQLAADHLPDGLEVVLQEAAEEDEEDRVVRDALHHP